MIPFNFFATFSKNPGKLKKISQHGILCDPLVELTHIWIYSHQLTSTWSWDPIPLSFRLRSIVIQVGRWSIVLGKIENRNCINACWFLQVSYQRELGPFKSERRTALLCMRIKQFLVDIEWSTYSAGILLFFIYICTIYIYLIMNHAYKLCNYEC